MPEGKMQFGIIIPKDLHRKVKHYATDNGMKISDVYARAANVILDGSRKESEETRLGRTITAGIQKDDWVLFEGLAGFLKDRPPTDKLEMLRLILGKYIPAIEASSPRRRNA